MERREIGCVLFAFALVVAGTFATGLLPSSAPYQAVAGGVIVAGFALLFYCFRPGHGD